MANIHEVFPSKYLRASDLGGVSPVVTIDRVEFEPVGRAREMKGVVYFAGKQKGLVLNKTNATKMAEIVGSLETDDWPGSRVQLYATEVEFQGDTVETIRCKAPATARKPIPPKPVPPSVTTTEHPADFDDSEIPFAWVLPLLLPLAGWLA